MGVLDSYAPAERSFARRVVIDLAVKQLGFVQNRLSAHMMMFRSKDISWRNAQEVGEVLLIAEGLLGEAVTAREQFMWPWDTNDFHEFWSHGGDWDALVSITEYMAQMPDWYRAIAAAEEMPAEYSQPLIDSIPGWHAK